MLTGHIIEKAQSGQRGIFYVLMEYLAFHIRALIATAEPGNCPRESFSLPLTGHSQGRWNQGTDFLNIFVPTCAFLSMHSECTNLAQGTFYALMGHLALKLHISAFIGTVEPRKLSQ